MCILYLYMKIERYTSVTKNNLLTMCLAPHQCCRCDVRLYRSCLPFLCRCWRRPAWWGSAAAPPPVCAAGWWCWRGEAAPRSSAAGWRSSPPAATTPQGALDSRPVIRTGWLAPGASEAGAGQRRWWRCWGRRTWGAPRSDCRTEEPPGGGERRGDSNIIIEDFKISIQVQKGRLPNSAL